MLILDWNFFYLVASKSKVCSITPNIHTLQKQITRTVDQYVILKSEKYLSEISKVLEEVMHIEKFGFGTVSSIGTITEKYLQQETRDTEGVKKILMIVEEIVAL